MAERKPLQVPVDVHEIADFLTREDIVILWHFSEGFNPPYHSRAGRKGPMEVLQRCGLITRIDKQALGYSPVKVNFEATPKGIEVLQILQRKNRLYTTPRESIFA